MKSNGGVMEVLTASRTPAHTLLSGPVAGSIAGKTLGESTAKKNVITFDMGGTSCDISVILEGEAGNYFRIPGRGLSHHDTNGEDQLSRCRWGINCQDHR